MVCRIQNEDLDVPVCKFGPGGQYERVWPAASTKKPQANSAGLFNRTKATAGWFAGIMDYLLEAVGLPDKRSKGSPAGPVRRNDIRTSISGDYMVLAGQSYRLVGLWRNSDEKTIYSAKQLQKVRLIETARCDSDSATGTNTSSYPSLSRQQWLFPDLAGVGCETSTKQSNSFRTCRSSRSKRACASQSKQGTFFDD